MAIDQTSKDRATNATRQAPEAGRFRGLEVQSEPSSERRAGVHGTLAGTPAELPPRASPTEVTQRQPIVSVDTIPIRVLRAPALSRTPTGEAFLITASSRAASARRARQQPAPSALRVFVGALALVLLGTLSGLVLLHDRPALFASLRNEVARSPSPTRRTSPGIVSTDIHLLSSSLGGAIYRVPTVSYAIVLTIDQPCWVTVSSPPRGAAVFAATLLPTSSPKTLELHGSSSIMVAARAVSIEIAEGSRSLGTIDAPIVGYTYTFDPVGS